jgi:hypothetical protein
MHLFEIGKSNFCRPLSPQVKRRIKLTTTIADDIPKSVRKSILPLVSELANFGNKKWFNFGIEKGKGLQESLVITSYPLDYEGGKVVKGNPFMSTLVDLNKINSLEYLAEVSENMLNVLRNIGK